MLLCVAQRADFVDGFVCFSLQPSDCLAARFLLLLSLCFQGNDYAWHFINQHLQWLVLLMMHLNIAVWGFHSHSDWPADWTLHCMLIHPCEACFYACLISVPQLYWVFLHLQVWIHPSGADRAAGNSGPPLLCFAWWALVFMTGSAI